MKSGTAIELKSWRSAIFIKYVYRISMALGIIVFLVIIGFSDFNLILSAGVRPEWVIAFVLLVITLGLQSVSFGVIGSVEFRSPKRFWFFWGKSVQATVANTGLPMSGSISKVASLKSQEGINLIDGTKMVVNVAIIRLSVLLAIALSIAPMNDYLRALFLSILLASIIIWIRAVPKIRFMKRAKFLFPARAISNPANLASIFFAELAVSLLGATSLWFVAQGFGIEIGFFTTVLIHSLGGLIGLVPLTPLGIGTRDAFLVGAMTFLEVNIVLAATFAVTERTILLLALLFAWLISLLLGKSLNDRPSLPS